MNERRDIALIKERLEYEDSFVSVPEADIIPYPEDLAIENEPFDYMISEEDERPSTFIMPAFRSERIMDMFFDECYEDQSWCDEYEPEFDPFDSLDELSYDF